jgi:SWI/SNF-related matrix-associated actin-dependent regulator 1 of chromatin subfamily A
MAEILEKKLTTRIQLKVDTLANWNSSALVLKKGEVAFATTAATAGSGLTEPVVMIKIGDGEHSFANLPFNFYAKAADVLEQAKDATKLTSFIQNVIADSGIATNDALKKVQDDLDLAEADIATLKGDVNTAGSIAQKIQAAIDNITVIDNAVTGQYVSAVSQVNGKVVVSREALPTYTLASGSANGTVAFNGDDIAVTGLGSAAYTDAKDYEVAGAAAVVEGKLNTYKTSNDAAVLAAKTQADKGVEDAAAALAKANEKTTMADVEAKGYATQAEAKGYADAKDSAIAAAKKAGEDAATALETYKALNDPAVALKADKTALEAEVARAKAAEEANAAAIALLVDSTTGDETKLNSIKELATWIEEHGEDAAEMTGAISANTATIAVNSAAINTEVERATAKEAELATAITDALAAAKKDSSDKDVVVLSEAQAYADQAEADALSAAKTYADTKASTAEAAAKTHAETKASEALASAKTYTNEELAKVDGKLADYYTKTEAEAAFMNSTETGTAIDAKIAALNLAATYEPKGALTSAKAYADGLASNYATAAQGEKADSALQEVKAGTGLKVTGKDTVEIDTDVVFVFDCGTSQA